MAEKKKGCCLSVVAVGLLGIIIVAVSGGKSSISNTPSSPTGQIKVETSETSQNSGRVATSESNEITKEENQIIYDNGEIKITYTGYIAEKTFSSAKVNFLIENNSSHNITVKNFNLNVNGYTFTTWFYEDVPAGKKTNTEMDISSSQLKNNGINTLGIIDMDFRCIDSDNYDEIFTTDNFEIIFDETVSNEENLDDYQLVIDNAGIQVYYKGENEGGFLSSVSYKFLVINNSERNVSVQSDNLSINDFAVSAYFHTDCMAGKKSNDILTISESDIKKNGIEKIEKIEFTLKCYDSDNFSDIWQQDNVEIHFDE